MRKWSNTKYYKYKKTVYIANKSDVINNTTIFGRKTVAPLPFFVTSNAFLAD
jgi:hypothetical protein